MANTPQVAVRMPLAMQKTIKQIARKDKRNFADMVRILLDEAITRRSRNHNTKREEQ